MEETADIFYTFDIVIDKKNNFTAVFNRVFENTSGVCPQRNTEAQVSNRCAVPFRQLATARSNFLPTSRLRS